MADIDKPLDLSDINLLFGKKKPATPEAIVSTIPAGPVQNQPSDTNSITVPFDEYLAIWNVLQLRSIPGIPGDEKALATMKKRIDERLSRR